MCLSENIIGGNFAPRRDISWTDTINWFAARVTGSLGAASLRSFLFSRPFSESLWETFTTHNILNTFLNTGECSILQEGLVLAKLGQTTLDMRQAWHFGPYVIVLTVAKHGVPLAIRALSHHVVSKIQNPQTRKWAEPWGTALGDMSLALVPPVSVDRQCMDISLPGKTITFADGWSSETTAQATLIKLENKFQPHQSPLCDQCTTYIDQDTQQHVFLKESTIVWGKIPSNSTKDSVSNPELNYLDFGQPIQISGQENPKQPDDQSSLNNILVTLDHGIRNIISSMLPWHSTEALRIHREGNREEITLTNALEPREKKELRTYKEKTLTRTVSPLFQEQDTAAFSFLQQEHLRLRPKLRGWGHAWRPQQILTKKKIRFLNRLDRHLRGQRAGPDRTVPLIDQLILTTEETTQHIIEEALSGPDDWIA